MIITTLHGLPAVIYTSLIERGLLSVVVGEVHEVYVPQNKVLFRILILG